MRAQAKTALRLFKKHMARLFTIMAIVIVSVGFMSGVGEAGGKLRSAIKGYYHTHTVSDLQIKSKNPFGFTAEEQAFLKDRYGEENVRKSFSYEIEEESGVTRIYSLDMADNAINQMEVLEGRLPEKGNEIVVERETTDFIGYAIGDKVRLQETDYAVCGIVYNPMLLAKLKEPSWQFEDEKVTKVVYFHTKTLPICNEAYVTLSNRALFDSYGKEYEEYIDGETAAVEAELGEENVSVLTLRENWGIASVISYSEKVEQIGIIFVVFFLLITLLIVYSTMTRLFDEERAQIACQKTLGFGSWRIVKKYVWFVAIATLVGGAIAFPVGYGLTHALYVGFNLQYEMPTETGAPSFVYYLITFGLLFVATVLLTIRSSLSLARQKPTALLTPKAPKSGKKVILERIPFIWNMLSFKYKSTCRNVLLFKSRFLMTVISVIGATVLVFAGMGLWDCTRLMEGAEMLRLISIILIVFSAALCALVIYNLTNINVSERTREVATLMVLGYHDNEVSGYIFREIYIMSCIGAVLGVPIGMLFVDFVFTAIDFGRLADVQWWTYILTPCITMAFSFISTLLLRKKIIKTDMNASLKTIE